MNPEQLAKLNGPSTEVADFKLVNEQLEKPTSGVPAEFETFKYPNGVIVQMVKNPMYDNGSYGSALIPDKRDITMETPENFKAKYEAMQEFLEHAEENSLPADWVDEGEQAEAENSSNVTVRQTAPNEFTYEGSVETLDDLLKEREASFEGVTTEKLQSRTRDNGKPFFKKKKRK